MSGYEQNSSVVIILQDKSRFETKLCINEKVLNLMISMTGSIGQQTWMKVKNDNHLNVQGMISKRNHSRLLCSQIENIAQHLVLNKDISKLYLRIMKAYK